MRKDGSILLAASLLFMVWTAPVTADSITVVIENVKQDKGKVMLQLLSGKDEFEGDIEPTAKFVLKARTGEMRVFTSNLPEGDYAVRVMHDVNNNEELDTNFVGLPTEPYAFSNNVTGNFGPPHWNDVKFRLSGSVVQHIKLIN